MSPQFNMDPWRPAKAAVLAVILLTLWMLAGCANTRPPSVCPPVKTYTKEQNEQLARELEALPPGAFTVDVIADYILLRDQVRACQ